MPQETPGTRRRTAPRRAEPCSVQPVGLTNEIAFLATSPSRPEGGATDSLDERAGVHRRDEPSALNETPCRQESRERWIGEN